MSAPFPPPDVCLRWVGDKQSGDYRIETSCEDSAAVIAALSCAIAQLDPGAGCALALYFTGKPFTVKPAESLS